MRVSSDGKSLYTLGTHDSGGLDLGGGLAWFARAADGTPTFAGCIEPFSGGGCAGAGHPAGLDGGRAIAIPGDGFSLYTASLGTSEIGGTSAIGTFVRDAPPSCASPPAQSVAVNTSTSIPLACNAPAGDPPSTGTVLTPPAHGSVTHVGGSSVTYTPNAGYTGIDNFSLATANAAGPSAKITVAVVVTADPGVPVCQPPAPVTVAPGTPVAISLPCLAPAGQQLTREIVTQPQHGTLGQVDQTAGTVTFTAPAGYVGADSFTFRGRDADGASPAQTVPVQVIAAPTAGGVSVDAVTDSSAVLHGTLNPGGGQTGYYFTVTAPGWPPPARRYRWSRPGAPMSRCPRRSPGSNPALPIPRR